MALLLLPALIFIFFMGWSLYWTGSKRDQKHTKTKAPEKENVALLPAVFEETEQIIIE
jgi:hypothetical protein